MLQADAVWERAHSSVAIRPVPAPRPERLEDRALEVRIGGHLQRRAVRGGQVTPGVDLYPFGQGADQFAPKGLVVASQ